MALICGCCLASKTLLDRWAKVIYAAFLVMSALMIWFTGSRAALMGSVVAALFVFYLRSAQKGTVIRQFLPVGYIDLRLFY